jgi:hypothetical protein
MSSSLVQTIARENARTSRHGRLREYHERLSKIANAYKRYLQDLGKLNTQEAKDLIQKIKPDFDAANNWIKEGKHPGDFDGLKLAEIEAARSKLSSEVRQVLKK